MKGRYEAARQGRLCGLWALALVTRLPRDVRRYIGTMLEWDTAYCWWCLKPYTISLRITLVEQLRSIDYATPRCWRTVCGVFRCHGGHALDERNPRPGSGMQRNFTFMGASASTCRRPEEHVKEMLAAFDFLCSLSGKTIPADEFGQNKLQLQALRLAYERKHRAHKAARAAALREQHVEERLRKEEQRIRRRIKRK
jgi:hypothetical protein